jgi:hypothetical protein
MRRSLRLLISCIMLGLFAPSPSLGMAQRVGPQACRGECEAGYLSVCVQRGSNCNCTCVKGIKAGEDVVRRALESEHVPSDTIDEAISKYSDQASKQRTVSFTVKSANDVWRISGDGAGSGGRGVKK